MQWAQYPVFVHCSDSFWHCSELGLALLLSLMPDLCFAYCISDSDTGAMPEHSLREQKIAYYQSIMMSNPGLWPNGSTIGQGSWESPAGPGAIGSRLEEIPPLLFCFLGENREASTQNLL